MVLRGLAALDLAGAIGFGLWLLYRYRERLPLAQMTGTVGLLALALVGLVLVVLFFIFLSAFVPVPGT